MSPLRVLCWLDGRPGHESQVRGILACLPTQATVHEVRLPSPPNETLERRLGVWCLGAKHMGLKPPSGLLEELLGAEWEGAQRLAPQLSIAAGTRSGLYSFAFGRLNWCPTVQAMTHGLLKTAFTLNIVPAHDRPKSTERIVVTRTAPNPYLPAVAHAAAEAFLDGEGLPRDAVYWSLLIGGPAAGDSEEGIDAGSVLAEVKSLLRSCIEHGARLCISTSRRTPEAVADALATLAEDPTVAFFQDFRTDQRRTAGALLGLATQAFLTPDSISMVSEALWAGRGATLFPLIRDARSQPVVRTAKHRRFLEALAAEEHLPWYGPSWEPPRTRSDEGFRHYDFLAIQSALRELITDATT